MASTIDLLRAKIARAKQHIQEFQLAVGAFHESKPYAVGVKEDAQAGQRVYYVAHVKDVPLELAVIAANVLQDI